MKPSIPDTGTVVKLDGDRAVVRMQGEGSCRKCGAAALGLCKMGQLQTLTVRNARQARMGDTVRIGLAHQVQSQGYFLGFIVPAAALVLGIAGGHILAVLVGIGPSELLDAFAGFAAMFLASFFSFRRLKRLDGDFSVEIVRVL